MAAAGRTLIARLAVAVALAAGITVGVRSGLVSRWFKPATSRAWPELATALAHEPTRLFEGRLSGDIAYAPARTPRRGEGDANAPPEVRIVVARLEVAARDHETPDTMAALGAAYVAAADWDRAVAALADAVEQAPRNSAFQNDLAVAYLGRAMARTRADDWVRALAAADRAIALDPQRPQAYFNRALAFNGLHLAVDALDAWEQYQAAERAGPWHVESRTRVEAMRQRSQALRPRSGLDHQAMREQIEDELLAEWGKAFDAGRFDDADRWLSDAGARVDRLAAAGGDGMARDEVAHVRRLRDSGNSRAVRELARGHLLFGAARRQYLADNQTAASTLMDQASAHFRRAGSPYAGWAPVYRALFLRSKGDSLRGLQELAQIDVIRLPVDYWHLRGRIAWTEALLRDAIARFDLAREQLAIAVAAYQSGGEEENLIATLTNLAEADWHLGNYTDAWTNLAAALSRIDARGSTRRTAHFDLAAEMAQGSGLPEAALDFQNAFVRVVTSPRARTEALLRRARTLLIVDRGAAAEADLQRASATTSEIDDAAIRDRIQADIEMVRVELLGRVDCAQSLERGEALRGVLARTGLNLHLDSLLAVLARCRRLTGDTAGAVAILQEAVGLVESRRRAIASASDRIQAFDAERAVYGELLTLEALNHDDAAAALIVAERSRDGVLAEVWRDRTAGWPAARLPPNVAVVYYHSLADRVLVWVITRDRTSMFTAPFAEPALRRSVDRVRRAIQGGADLVRLRPVSAGLFDALIAPALRRADGAGTGAPSSNPTVVFVPDAALFALPFGALPDEAGRPLIDTRTVVIAPSLHTFLAASARLATFEPRDVLAVGDSHDVRTSGLPLLPRANDEAVDVAGIYPKSTLLLGTDATRGRLLQERASVIHFAGHSVLNERYPMFSRMLLAPHPGSGDPGWLQASEIAAGDFVDTGVVVLASCDAAAGGVALGEGAISLARAFFAAGVPAVVASLWPVDDDLQTIFRTFHRTLTTERDPARALRAGQLAILRERGSRTPVRVWGGFILLGGATEIRP